MRYATPEQTRPQSVLAGPDELETAWNNLGKAIRIGMVRGVVGLNGRKSQAQDPALVLALARELIRQDILVLITDLEPDTLPEADLDGVGVGLAEFCTLCDIPAMVPCRTQDAPPLATLCARLTADLEADAGALPVTADQEGAGLDALPVPAGAPFSDIAAIAASISRYMTIKRLALGLNDRFDGSVYS